jgi:hypothetical protein
MLDYSLTITENSKVFKESIYQAVENDKSLKPSWVYNDDDKNEYMDPYHSGNLIDKISASTYSDMAGSDWYGEQSYYNHKLF